MKELSPLAILPALLALTVPREDYDFWEKQFDKWGIALVSLLFFVALAWVSYKKDKSREARQNKKDDEREARQALRDDNNQTERTAILTRMADANDKMIELQTSSKNEIKRSREESQALNQTISQMSLKMKCTHKPLP